MYNVYPYFRSLFIKLYALSPPPYRPTLGYDFIPLPLGTERDGDNTP